MPLSKHGSTEANGTKVCKLLPQLAYNREKNPSVFNLTNAIRQMIILVNKFKILFKNTCAVLNMKGKKKKNIANRKFYRHDICKRRLQWTTSKRLTIFLTGKDREWISCSDWNAFCSRFVFFNQNWKRTYMQKRGCWNVYGQTGEIIFTK